MLPKGWDIKPLSEVAIFSSGGTPSKQNPNFWGGSIPWITAASMYTHDFYTSNLMITKEGLDDGSRLARKGSLLLLVRGSMLWNKIPIGIASIDVSFNQDVKAITPKEIVNNRFLFYWFLSSENKLLNMVVGTGIGAGKLDTQSLLEMQVPTPPLLEQIKIANIISTWDKAITTAEQLLTKSLQQKKALMRELLTGKNRLLDNNGVKFKREWEWVSLDSICDVKGGKRLPKGGDLTTTKTPHPYIRVADMYMGGVKIDDIKYVPIDVAPKIKHYLIHKEDLFITVAGTLGLAGKIPDELDGANLTENADKLTNIKCNKDFLLYVMKSDIIQRYVESESTKNAQPKLALARIRGFKIPQPSKEEQQKIADVLSASDKETDTLRQKIDCLKLEKKCLMQQLLTGKRRVNIN